MNSNHSPINLCSTDSSPSPPIAAEPKLDLSHLPPVYVLPIRLTEETLHSLEHSLTVNNAPLTYDLAEAKLVIADLNTARRCEMELREKGLWTQKVGPEEEKEMELENAHAHAHARGLGVKQKPEEQGQGSVKKAKGQENPHGYGKVQTGDKGGLIKVVKIKWLTETLETGNNIDMGKYVVYIGKKVPPLAPSPRSPEGAEPARKRPKLGSDQVDSSARARTPTTTSTGILERAKLDAQQRGHSHGIEKKPHRPGRQRESRAGKGEIGKISHQPPSQPTLTRKSTEEWELEQSLIKSRPLPEYITKNLKYSCQRCTPLNTPNDHFISLLGIIKLSRILSMDQIGIRAYSTCIASIAAYPYPLVSSAELCQLPGCDGKIASLFHEYIHSTSTPPHLPDTNRALQVIKDFEASEEFVTLRLFWGIWGVGVITAREFYFEKGWKSLDDVVEFGWDSLSRVQQIGLKYYNELNDIKIPREEVSRIGSLILAAMRKVGGEHWGGLICGGYRRGKTLSGDVDIVLSHPDESLFENHPGGKGSAAVEWVSKLVSELEDADWVTHTLYLGHGGGFGSQRTDHHHVPTTSAIATPISTLAVVQHEKDTLAKAMLVWQEQQLPNPSSPSWSETNRNPHPHRRVDIILTPPSSAATAILGWTGATTFERDLRRFVKKYKGWKFDSGGVWDRRTGERVPGLGGWETGKSEDGEDGGETLEMAERRLIEGLGLGWVEPEMRNTG